MNPRDVRELYDHLKAADDALKKAMAASGGDVPIKWPVDIAKAHQLVHPMRKRSEAMCGLSRSDEDTYE
ncbi:hypothetical protein [Salicola sp. Rm-C-2C1-2]|uniref:hypothetical protein n=1 Tax=Salicola sp. Rm-C-2C1-2 TaxID=3141321 RepID=UPI0032E44DD8